MLASVLWSMRAHKNMHTHTCTHTWERMHANQVVRFLRVLVGILFRWLKSAVHPNQMELYKSCFDV